MKNILTRTTPAMALLLGITGALLVGTTTVANAAPLPLRSQISLPFDHPADIVMDSANEIAYISDSENNSISAFSTATDSVVGPEILVPYGANNLAFNPKTSELAVSSKTGKIISLFNTITGEFGTISVSSRVGDLEFNPATNELWFTQPDENAVSVVNMNIAPRSVKTTLSVGAFPYSLSVDQTVNRVYVANIAGKSVSLIDGASHTVDKTLYTARSPERIATDINTHKVYLTRGNLVDIFDGITGRFDNSDLRSGAFPVVDIAVDPSTKKVFTINNSGELRTLDAVKRTFEPASSTIAHEAKALTVSVLTGEVLVVGPMITGAPATVTVLEQNPRIAPVITSGDPTAAVMGKDYSFQIETTGRSPMTYTVSSGRLPWGLDLDPTTGEIYGTPTGFFGPFINTFTITVTNTYGTTNATYTIVTRATP